MFSKMVVGTFRLSTGRKTAVEEGTCMTLQRDRIRQKLEMEMGLILNRKSECESAVELLDTRTEKDQRLHPLHDAVNLCHFSGASLTAHIVKNLPTMQETRV